MWSRIRLTLEILVLIGLLGYAYARIRADPERAAPGEFAGLLLFVGCVFIFGYLWALVARGVCTILRRNQEPHSVSEDKGQTSS